MGLSILLPAASPFHGRSYQACLLYASILADKVSAILGDHASASVVVGMDADDPATAIFSEMIHRHSICHHVNCVIFHANDLCRARQEAL